MRAAAGLPAMAGLTDPTITAGVTTIKSAHVTQLRTALDQARAALGLGAVSHTDPSLPSIVKAAHVQDLRNGVK